MTPQTIVAESEATSRRIFDLVDGISPATPEGERIADLLREAARLVPLHGYRVAVADALEDAGLDEAHEPEHPQDGEYVLQSRSGRLDVRAYAETGPALDAVRAALAPFADGYSCDDRDPHGIDWSGSVMSSGGFITARPRP